VAVEVGALLKGYYKEMRQGISRGLGVDFELYRMILMTERIMIM
jgi:hypothetical protein